MPAKNSEFQPPRISDKSIRDFLAYKQLHADKDKIEKALFMRDSESSVIESNVAEQLTKSNLKQIKLLATDERPNWLKPNINCLYLYSSLKELETDNREQGSNVYDGVLEFKGIFLFLHKIDFPDYPTALKVHRSLDMLRDYIRIKRLDPFDQESRLEILSTKYGIQDGAVKLFKKAAISASQQTKHLIANNKSK